MPPGSKFEGLTVGDIMQQNKIYLIWCYFNYDRLSFVDSILNALRIREEDRIKKPGKAPEKADYYQNRNHAAVKTIIADRFKKVKGIDKEGAFGAAKKVLKKDKKRKYINYAISDSFKHKKSAMAWKNQGHK